MSYRRAGTPQLPSEPAADAEPARTGAHADHAIQRLGAHRHQGGQAADRCTRECQRGRGVRVGRRILDRHEICGNGGGWINAVSLALSGVNDQSFHPNDKGQRDGYAQAVNDVLNPGPMPGLKFGASAPRTVSVDPSGLVRLSRRIVACPAGPITCLVTTEVRAVVRAAVRAAAVKSTRVGQSRAYVAPGRGRTVRFALTKTGRRALCENGRINATVKITVRYGNHARTMTVTVTRRRASRAQRASRRPRPSFVG